jgi:type II secretory pathway component PulF
MAQILENLRIDTSVIETLWMKMALDGKVRLRIYRKIAALTRTGMPLPRAIEILRNLASQGGKKNDLPLVKVIDRWRSRVLDGRSFGEAMADWVPVREWMIVEAGSADLAEALEEVCILLENSGKMKSAVLTAVGYPLFLAGLVSVLLWIFSVDAIPAFSQIKPMDQWEGLAWYMGVMSKTVQIGLIPFVLLVVALVALSIWSLPRWVGNWRLRFEAFPPWSLYRLISGSAFMTALAAFVLAGMPVPEALRRLRAAASPWLTERLDATLYYLNSGQNLGEALHLAGHGFPDRELIEDLRVFASLGNLDEALKRLSKEWLNQNLENLRSVGDVMKVLGMVMVAAVIALIQAGIFAIQHQLTSGPT